MSQDYRELAVWQKAVALGKSVRTLTEEYRLEASANVIIGGLYAATEALPVCIAVDCTNRDIESLTHSTRIAYDHAHRIEYLLFLSLLWDYLPYGGLRPLMRTTRHIKALLAANLQELRKGGCR